MEALFNGRLVHRLEARPSDLEIRLVKLMTQEAARVLGIEVPSIIQFYYRSPYDQTLGYAGSDGEICLAAGLAPMDLLRVVIHEMRHCWQFQQPEWRARSDQSKERDAVLFELTWPNGPGDDMRDFVKRYAAWSR